MEIASGTGEHALYLAEQFPNHAWLPTDINPAALASIAAWRCQQEPLANLCAPIFLDVESCPWPVELTPPAEPITAIVAFILFQQRDSLRFSPPPEGSVKYPHSSTLKTGVLLQGIAFYSKK